MKNATYVMITLSALMLFTSTACSGGKPSAKVDRKADKCLKEFELHVEKTCEAINNFNKDATQENLDAMIEKVDGTGFYFVLLESVLEEMESEKVNGKNMNAFAKTFFGIAEPIHESASSINDEISALFNTAMEEQKTNVYKWIEENS